MPFTLDEDGSIGSNSAESSQSLMQTMWLDVYRWQWWGSDSGDRVSIQWRKTRRL